MRKTNEIEYEFLIDLEDGDRVKVYSESGLFQKDAYTRVTKILQNKKKYLETLRHEDDISTCRMHDTIFIGGDRGTGKTAFLVNIKNYAEAVAPDVADTFTFLKPVDPTLLEDNEHFIAIILGLVVSEVDPHLSRFERGSCDMKAYFNALRDISESLKSLKDRKEKETVGIEEIASSQNSLKLEQHAHIFFKMAARITGKKGFVILIDDIDMCFSKGYEVLEVVRRNLASPYITPVVTGELSLYTAILKSKFKRLLAAESPKLIEMCEQYLLKVFPNENRVYLTPILELLRTKNAVIRINGKEIPYYLLRDVEVRMMNLNVNQREATQGVFVDNARLFLQYLLKKREELELIATKFPFGQGSQRASHMPYTPANLSEIDEFIGRNFVRGKNIEKLRLSYQKTSEAYKYISERSSLYAQAKNDAEAISDGSFNHRVALNSYISASDDRRREKIVEDLFISKTNFRTQLSSLSDESAFLMGLFVHDDYYSSYQTKFLLVGGKFFELMFASLDSSIDESVLSKIMLGVPYNSAIPENRYMNIASSEEEDAHVQLSEAYVITMAERIRNWKSDYIDKQKVNILSTHFINRSAKKFFNNLNILKIGRHEESENINSGYMTRIAKHDLVGESLHTFFHRIVAIFLNAIASFESAEPVASINIAIGKNFDYKNLDKSDNAYRTNVAPLISSINPTFVNAFNDHPVVRLLLELDDTSELGRFTIGRKASSRELLVKGTISAWEHKEYSEVLNRTVDLLEALRPSQRSRLLPLLKNPKFRWEQSVKQLQDSRSLTVREARILARYLNFIELLTQNATE